MSELEMPEILAGLKQDHRGRQREAKSEKEVLGNNMVTEIQKFMTGWKVTFTESKTEG